VGFTTAPTAAERAALRCYLRWHGRVGMRAAAAPAAANDPNATTRWTLGAEAAAPHPAPQHPPEEWVPQLLLSPASAAVRGSPEPYPIVALALILASTLPYPQP